MTRYPRYKNSGVYYLCPLPERWELKRAKTLFRQEKRAVRPDDGVVTCFRDGQVTLRTNRRVEGFTNSLKEIGYQGVRKGDLVIHNMDAFAGSVGVSESDGKMSPVCSICTPIRADVNVTYFALMLRVLAKTGFIKSLAKGIRERSTDFRYSDFKELLLPLPPLPEQEAIVRYLDETTGKIDKAIAAEERLIELLQERKQIIINEAVGGNLSREEVQRRRELPKGWELRKVKQCAMIEHGCDPKTEGNIPVYGSGAESFKTCGEYKEGPTVLLGRKGTVNIPRYVVGRYWNVDTAFNVYVRPNMLLRFSIIVQRNLIMIVMLRKLRFRV